MTFVPICGGGCTKARMRERGEDTMSRLVYRKDCPYFAFHGHQTIRNCLTFSFISERLKRSDLLCPNLASVPPSLSLNRVRATRLGTTTVLYLNDPINKRHPLLSLNATLHVKIVRSDKPKRFSFSHGTCRVPNSGNFRCSSDSLHSYILHLDI